MRGIVVALAKAGTLALAALNVAGCGPKEEAIVTLNYVLAPSRGLPAGLTAIAIQPAELGAATDEKWSAMTAETLAALILESTQASDIDLKIVRVDEARKVFEKADMDAVGMSAGTGQAKVADFQAYIVSEVNIKEDIARGKMRTITGISMPHDRDQRKSHRRTRNPYRAGDPPRNSGPELKTTEVEKVKKTVTAQAKFTLIDARTAEAWESHEGHITSTEETKPSPFFGSSEGEAGLTMTDQIAATLVERVAREFVAELMPIRVEVEIGVESSRSEPCAAGVAALRAEDYEESISCFEAALVEKPDDHRAMFAAGVACEKLNRPDDALQWYKRAVREDDRKEYLAALDRLKKHKDRIRVKG